MSVYSPKVEVVFALHGLEFLRFKLLFSQDFLEGLNVHSVEKALQLILGTLMTLILKNLVSFEVVKRLQDLARLGALDILDKAEKLFLGTFGRLNVFFVDSQGSLRNLFPHLELPYCFSFAEAPSTFPFFFQFFSLN